MPTVAPPTRSTFVTALAWTFIVLGGFATLISLLQNIMIAVMFPVAEMQEIANQAKGSAEIPPFAAFMFQHMQLVFLAFLGVTSATLVSAIGLLMRKNWARLTFIALMGFGILWCLAGVAFSIMFVSSIAAFPAQAPAEFADQFNLMAKIMVGVNVLMAVAFSALFGWIIKRLVSDEVRREFSAV